MLSGLLEDTLPPAQDAKKTYCERRPLMVVGGNVIVLKHFYDQDQHWFDFMRGVIFEAIPEPVKKPPSLYKKPKTTKFARQKPDGLKLFVYRKGRDQFCLPFPDRLKLSANRMAEIGNAEFPSWDKNSDGKVPAVNYHKDRKLEFEEWCSQNCIGFYGFKNGEARFQHSREYILARMMFGEN